MTLAVLKHGGKWDFLARMFSLSASSFERLVMKFVHLISEAVYESYVDYQARKWSVDLLKPKDRRFRNYPMARFATDVTFQPRFRPSGSIEEGKKYFSGKHKLYGYKVEFSVLPCGVTLGASLHEPGSVSDLVIFQQMQSFHRKQLRKTSEEADIFDEDPLSERYPNHWAVLTDKGYQGGQEFCRVIHPTRKPSRGVLTPAEVAENHHISSDRIIAENFFGRLCGLWNVLYSKWKWDENNYDAVFRLCLGLTNFHISRKPLRAADAILYQQVTNRWYKIGTSQSERRRRI